ncbi:MAG: hypothetical protein ACKOZT_10465 [Cyanobium sp.]
MAEYPMPDNAPQRYADLERAYVQERWLSVRGNGPVLLEELEESDDPQAEALANRLRVLLGHAHLYGMGEPEIAEDFYRAVITGNAEADLRQIAAQGLEQCQRPAVQPVAAGSMSEPLASPQPGTEPSTPAPSASAEAEPAADPFQAAVASAMAAGSVQHTSEPAMPWLQDLASGSPGAMATEAEEGGGALAPRLEVEVVEEPELLEVAQADPSLAEELELELSRIRERRASTAAASAAQQGAAPESARSPVDPFAAAIAAAAAEVAARPQRPDPLDTEASGATIDPAELQAFAPDSAETREQEGERDPNAEEAATPDLSLEDPELVAALLRVVLQT